jgi:hypothetical protein
MDPSEAQAQSDDGTRKPSNPKDIAAQQSYRLSASLLPWAAIFESGLAACAGDAKYGAYNYVISQVSATTYLDAIFSHWLAALCGGDYDPEDLFDHMGAVIMNASIYLQARNGGFLIDDRPPFPKNLRLLYQSYQDRARTIYEKHGRNQHRWTQKDVVNLVKQWHQLQEEKKKTEERESHEP